MKKNKDICGQCQYYAPSGAFFDCNIELSEYMINMGANMNKPWGEDDEEIPKGCPYLLEHTELNENK